MTILIDAKAQGQSSSATTVAATITTTHTNDMLLVLVGMETGGSAPSVSGISGGGLTFTQRARLVNGTQVNEVWYAQTTAVLSAVSVTVTFNMTIDDCGVFLAALYTDTGGALAFDGNASLPATSTTRPTATASSNSGSPYFYAVTGYNRGASAATPMVPSGMTQQATITNSGATYWEMMSWGGGYFTTQQTNVAFGWTTVPSGSTLIVDAVQSSQIPFTGSTSSRSLLSGELSGGELPFSSRTTLYSRFSGKLTVIRNFGTELRSWAFSYKTPTSVSSDTSLNYPNYNHGPAVRNTTAPTYDRWVTPSTPSEPLVPSESGTVGPHQGPDQSIQQAYPSRIMGA
jgi:hypothetical protein